jgi:hypothetical protein
MLICMAGLCFRMWRWQQTLAVIDWCYVGQIQLMTWHCVNCVTDTTSGATLDSPFTGITGCSRNTVPTLGDMIMHLLESEGPVPQGHAL